MAQIMDIADIHATGRWAIPVLMLVEASQLEDAICPLLPALSKM